MNKNHPTIQTQHILAGKGISPSFFPNQMTVRVVSLDTAKQYRQVQVTHRSINHKLPIDVDDEVASVTLRWHHIIFDTIKIQLMEKWLLSQYRAARAIFKLSDLPSFTGAQIVYAQFDVGHFRLYVQETK